MPDGPRQGYPEGGVNSLAVPPSAPRYWPTWTSVALLAAGAIVMVAMTASLLVLLGAAFLGLGLYGISRRPRRSAA